MVGVHGIQTLFHIKRKEIQRLWDKRLINYSIKDWEILRNLNKEYFDKHLIN